MLKTANLLVLSGLALCLAACGNDTTETAAADAPVLPQLVFPGEEIPDPYHRAYTLTENAEGTVRVFTRETRDDTDLYEMLLQDDGSWSEPVKLDWPKLRSNVAPHFSPFDGRLYFASDRPAPGLENRDDMNIWSIERTEDGWGEAEYVPGNIHYGSDETSVTTTANGDMYFVSQRREGPGGHDFYVAHYDETTEGWIFDGLLPEGNTSLVESHIAATADGRHLVFYSRMRPILGNVDLKVLTRADDGSWIGPYTLGPNINSRGIEFGASFSATGDTFFYSQEGRLVEVPMDAFMAEIDAARAAYLADEELQFLGLSDN